MILLIAGVVLLLLVAAGATIMNMRAAAHAEAAADEVRATVDQLVDALAQVFTDAADEDQRRYENLTSVIAKFHELTMESEEKRGAHLVEHIEGLKASVDGLQSHQSAMDAMADQQVALRKQVKAVLRGGARVNATADRINRMQYAQQKDVDDILYWVRHERDRGELNG